MSDINETLKFGMKAKQQMLDQNLTSAKKACPRCGKWVKLRLAGKKNHLHMSCETEGCMWMMG